VAAISAADDLTVASAADLLASGKVSAVELVEDRLRVIRQTEPAVHAYAYVAFDLALHAARAADIERARGAARGPLHGIPYAVKDVFFTRDMPTEAGSRVLAGFVPDSDAAAVRQLREAGAILLGKLATHEFACGQNDPPTRNAWTAEHRPGGSSAGAGVAVAVGSALAALGTDAGGSVRKPAALNGVVGLKPTYGRISRLGVLPLHSSLDTVGVVARTAEDVGLVLDALSEPDPAAWSKPSSEASEPRRLQSKIRLGISDYFFGSDLNDEIRATVDTALREFGALGVKLVPVALPALRQTLAVGFTIFLAEAGASHHRWLRERPLDYDPRTRRVLELGYCIPAAHLVAAYEIRARIKAELMSVFRSARLDGLVSATLPLPSADARTTTAADLSKFLPYVFPANLSGQPAITLPCGFTSAGSPAGLQFIGRPYDEKTLLRLGIDYQSRTDWHTRRPPLTLTSDA